MNKKELSALEVMHIVEEFRDLLNAKIDKIYQKENSELALQVHVPNVGKKIIQILLPSFAYISEHKREFPQRPPGFCMFMRKKLVNARLRDIKQHNFERIIIFRFSTIDSEYRIIVEMFGAGNAILVDSTWKILGALHYQKYRDRTVRPGIPYEMPPGLINPVSLELNEFSKIIKESDAGSTIKTLAIRLGLGGMYAEEICFRAGYNKTRPGASEVEIKKLFNAMKDVLNEKRRPVIIKDGDTVLTVLPFPIHKYDGKDSIPRDSFSSALDEVLSTIELQSRKTQVSKYDKQKKKIEAMITAQKEAIKRLEQDAKTDTSKGELLYEHYSIVDEILTEIIKARKKLSWSDIKERVKNHPIIKKINEKNNRIVIELG